MTSARQYWPFSAFRGGQKTFKISQLDVCRKIEAIQSDTYLGWGIFGDRLCLEPQLLVDSSLSRRTGVDQKRTLEDFYKSRLMAMRRRMLALLFFQIDRQGRRDSFGAPGLKRAQMSC